MLKKLIIIITAITLLLLTGCANIEINIEEPQETEIETVYYTETETMEQINEINCNGYLRGDNQLNFDNNRLIFEFRYVGAESSNISKNHVDIAGKNNCEIIEIKNMDTSSSSNQEDVRFLNGQTGRVIFTCDNIIESDLEILNGQIILNTINIKTGLKIPTICEVINKEELISELTINEEALPKIIGSYSLENVEINDEEEGVNIIVKYINPYNDSDSINLMLIKIKEEFKEEVDKDIIEASGRLESQYGTLIQINHNVVAFYGVEHFDFIAVENHNNKLEINTDILKWAIEEFQIDSKKINELNLKNEYNYQNDINAKIEEVSSKSSAITIERLETNGNVYIKNSGSNNVEILALKISQNTEDFDCEFTEGILPTTTVEIFNLNCSNEIVRGKIYNLIATTENGVFSTKTIAR